MRGFRRAKCRRTRVHVDRRHEGAENRRAARAHQLAIGNARQHFRHNLRQRARHRNWRHGAPHDEGRNDRSLVIGGKNLQSPHHRIVKGHRRVDVDQAGHHRAVCQISAEKQNARHINRILCPRRFGHRAHIRLVRKRHMREQHVQMPLVHRNICRLAHRAARMVQPLRHIAKFHEVAEIFHSRIAPTAFGIMHEGRAIHRGQHHVLAANIHRPLRIAGMLGIRRRSRST